MEEIDIPDDELDTEEELEEEEDYSGAGEPLDNER
jgi:hypothetical protein